MTPTTCPACRSEIRDPRWPCPYCGAAPAAASAPGRPADGSDAATRPADLPPAEYPGHAAGYPPYQGYSDPGAPAAPVQYAPAPSDLPVPTGPTGPTGPRTATLTIVAVLVAAAIGVAFFIIGPQLYGASGRGTASPTTASAPASGTGPGTAEPSAGSTPSASTRPTTGPATTAASAGVGDRSADGLILVAPGATEGISSEVKLAVLAVFDQYVTGVVNHDPASAYRAYSPAQQAKNPYPAWSKNVAQSSIEAFTVTAVSAKGSTVAAGPIQVTTSFVSRQPAALGPSPGETCSRWRLIYTLKPDPTSSGYLIDGARPASGTGHTAC